jgi:hypothetical protein
VVSAECRPSDWPELLWHRIEREPRVRRTARIVLRALRQASVDGIEVDEPPVFLIVVPISNSMAGEASLPDFHSCVELPHELGGVLSSYALYRLRQRQRGIRCQQDVKVIRHHDEFVQAEATLLPKDKKRFQE